MTKSRALFLVVAALVVGRCATAPPPAVSPRGDDRFLVDPRTGFEPSPPPAGRNFDAAWRFFLSGNDAEAERRLVEISKTRPDWPPVPLLRAAMDIRAGRLDEAAAAIENLKEEHGDALPVRIYAAEIATRRKQTKAAFDLYDAIVKIEGAPAVAAERLAVLRAALFNETLAAARASSGEESIDLLRQSLGLEPESEEARILLAQRLLELRMFDEARKELDPLLDTAANRSEVQEILAEIEVGRGRYEEAIVRYERLARSSDDEKYPRRLEEIKREWSAANMPAYYRNAVQSLAVTREQLAVLLFWNIPSVRFARNLGTPPIALDIAEVEGRDEIIRAIALGIFDVDPVTRNVSPHRLVTPERMNRFLARVLQLRGAPCTRGVAADAILGACEVTPVPDSEESTVAGSAALGAIEQVAKALQQ